MGKNRDNGKKIEIVKNNIQWKKHRNSGKNIEIVEQIVRNIYRQWKTIQTVETNIHSGKKCGQWKKNRVMVERKDS